ncbi:DMT family transporter [Halobacteriales archaeon Cl-PHB]
MPALDGRRVTPLVALGLAILAVSTSAILIRWSHAPPQVAAFYRVALTLLILTPVTVARHTDAVRRLAARDVLVAGGAGVALALHFAAWFESLSWTSVAASVTLVQLQPIFVAVGAWALLDERVTGRMLSGILVALLGSVVLSLGDLLTGAAAVGAWPLWGNALALLGAVAMAAYLLVGRSLRQRLSLLPYVTVVYATCTVGLLAFVLAAGFPLAGYQPREWLLFLAMAVGPGIVGHTVVNWVLEELESAVVSVSLVAEPVGSTALAAVLLGEVPGWLTVAGGVVVLAGIALTARSRAGA